MPFPPPGDLSDPGIKSVSAALAGGLFLLSHQGSPPRGHMDVEYAYEKMFDIFTSVQFSSVAQSCPTLCDPMNRSMPVQYFRERQIKTTVRNHYASTRTVKIFKTEYNNQWWEWNITLSYLVSTQYPVQCLAC